MTMATQAEKQPVQIKISEILKMLENGQDRKAIAKHYGLTQATVKRLFEHPQLKNRRVKPTVPVDLVDDVTVEETAAAPVAPVSTEASAPVAETPAAVAPAAATEAPAAPQAATAAADKGVW